MDERWVLPGLGRRQFLMGAAATAALVAAGCSDQGDEVRSESTDPATVAAVEAPAAEGIDGDPFPLGVASGDPTASAVVLWTRLAPDPLAGDGNGAMPAEDLEVAWDLALDDGFEQLVASDVVVARADHAHAVHVDATGLAAGTTYWYRFRIGDATSTVGRTRTLADGSPERFALAVANCQMFESGRYAAWRHLVDEDIDLVAFLGDYIYEYAPDPAAARRPEPDRLLETVADYRLRYASYKLDEDLAAAHAAVPFVTTWDDHEVANNYMGDTVPGDVDVEAVRARKAAAYQAWWEHTATRAAPPEGSDLTVHQSFDVGDLVRFYLLDQRQDAEVPPCRDTSTAGLDYGDCDEVDQPRSRLGADQEAWFAEQTGASTARWNLVGNPVVLAGVDAGVDAPAYYLDTWDGYPEARKALISQLAGTENPVVLTGDYHAGMTLDVHEVPFDQDSPVVAAEFMAPPISSGLFAADVSARTPQLREQINAHGYLVVEVTPDELVATFRTLDDVTDPDSAITTASTWTVAAGDPVAQQV
jgi:alkaline phosphatase D